MGCNVTKYHATIDSSSVQVHASKQQPAATFQLPSSVRRLRALFWAQAFWMSTFRFWLVASSWNSWAVSLTCIKAFCILQLLALVFH